MASKKRLSELEYNVFKKDLDSHNAPEGMIGTKDAGCLTMIAGIIVTILVIVVILGFMQIGRSRPALTCAYPGCSNHLKPGSSYCWLHSKSGSGSKKSGKDLSSSSSSSGGSVIGGSSGSSDSTKKKSKIWSGSTDRESKGSGSDGTED